MKYNQWMQYKINEDSTYIYVFSKDAKDNYWAFIVNLNSDKTAKRFGLFEVGFIFDAMEPTEYTMDKHEMIQLVFENKTP